MSLIAIGLFAFSLYSNRKPPPAPPPSEKLIEAPGPDNTIRVLPPQPDAPGPDNSIKSLPPRTEPAVPPPATGPPDSPTPPRSGDAP